MQLAIHPLQKRIAEGEGQTLDFKKTITSAQKIAVTLAAFANSQGGSLLIGVRDNGTVCGCNPHEEWHMIDSAAHLYCQPLVPYSLEVHDYRAFQVLEIRVPSSPDKPHQARNEQNEWRTYLRVADKSQLASPIMHAVLLRTAKSVGTLIQYTHREQALLNYLQQHGKATFDQLATLAAQPRKRSALLLVNLISAGLVRVLTTDRAEYYTLA